MHSRRRQRWHDRATRLEQPVLSIGNLHWGGGGKTPVTAAVARHLRDQGRRLAILSRGYGRKDSQLRVVSRGRGPMVSVETAGDEPFLLASELEGVSIVVGPDRARAAHFALEHLDPEPQIFLLDDGFSHLRLHRDLDLLVFPASDPLAGGRLLPAGRLREPLASVRYAHALLLTGAPQGDLDGSILASSLRRFGFEGPGFDCPSAATLVPADGDRLRADAHRRCLLVSAVARPESVRETAEGLGLEIVDHLVFRDHHSYPKASLERIRRRARELDSKVDSLVTTSKDRVKLEGRLSIPMSEIRLEARPSQDFWQFLDRCLEDLWSNRV